MPEKSKYCNLASPPIEEGRGPSVETEIDRYRGEKMKGMKPRKKGRKKGRKEDKEDKKGRKEGR